MILSFLILIISINSLSWLTDMNYVGATNGSTDDSIEAVDKETVAKSYADLPIYFIPNEEQLPDAVKYYSKGAGYSFYLTDDGVTYSFIKEKEEQKSAAASNYEGYSLKLNFLGRNPNTKIVGAKKLEGRVNYFIGDDASKWKTNIPVYEGAIYKDLYQGIDLAYKGSERIIKYEYKVSPGADYKDIRMSYSGVDSLKLSSSGNLLIHTPWGELKDEKPIIYQMVDGKKKRVDGAFALTNNTVGFTVGSYDKSIPLMIDPGLSYSTYFGGGSLDQASDIDVDNQGNAYITGMTSASGFPLQSPFDPGYNGSEDVYVTKFDPSGGNLVYSTYLGGFTNDQGKAIETDSRGNAYITGFTFSTNFPRTPGMPIGGGYQDAFLTKINPTGSTLIYSRFLGGGNNPLSGGNNTIGNGIEINRDDEVFISGQTNSDIFPVTTNAYQTTLNKDSNIQLKSDAFLMHIDSSGNNILYATYIGGDDDDISTDVAMDRNNIAYVVGNTESSINFPITSGAFRTSYGTVAGEGFVTLIDPKGQGTSDLVYSTYIGGDGAADDEIEAIAVDDSGNAYIAGSVYWLSGFITSPGAFQEYVGANTNYDAFVFKLAPAGNGYNDMVYSTLLGGSFNDRAMDIELDKSGNAYVAGFTNSIDYPDTPATAYDTSMDTQDAFVTIVNSTGAGLVDSTFLGSTGIDSAFGIGLDLRNNVYVTGQTDSAVFPLSNAYSSSTNDIFVTKFDTTNDPFAGSLSDLTITSITSSKANPDTSETITIDVVVKNQGATLTIPFDVDLHDNPVPAPPLDGQPGVDYQTISGLLPNQETTVTFNISWPQGGYHDLYASVDTLLSIVETNETNNISGPVNIMVSKPDLVIDSLSISNANADINETVDVDVVVRNQGNIDATTFKLDLYDNPVSTPTVGVGGIFSNLVSGLSVGSSTTVNFQISWGSNGTHNLIAQTDTYNAIPELLESNNLSNSEVVTVLSQPDLVINSMTASNLNPGTGEAVTVDIIVKNQGSANAPASSLTLYDNPSPEPPIVNQAGWQTLAVPLLTPGASTILTFSPSWPSNGSHRLYASADSAGSVTENDETNNIKGPTVISVFSVVSGFQAWDSRIGNWSWSAGKYTTGDFNGDGKTDIAVLYGYRTEREVKIFVFKGNNTGFDPPQQWWASGRGNWDWAGSMLTAGDYNGDGRSDLSILYGYKTERDVRIFVFPSTGVKFNGSQVWFHAGPNNWDWAGSKLVSGNFNGDKYNGKDVDDLGILYGYKTERDVRYFVFPSNRFTFGGSQVWYHAGRNNWDWEGSKLTVGDYVGSDGKDDLGILYGYKTERDVRIFVFPSTGSKLKSSQIWWHAGPGNWDWNGSAIMSGEFTGDVFDDMAIFYGYGNGKSTIFIFPSNTVNAFTGSVKWYGPASYDFRSSMPFSGNFDGAGTSEIANFYNNGSSWSRIYLYR